MDRRGHRAVIDPMVRQVGFVTPGADSAIKAGAPEAIPASTAAGLHHEGGASSPAPVLIPLATSNADPASLQDRSSLRKNAVDVDSLVPPLLSMDPPESLGGTFTAPTTPTPARKDSAADSPGEKHAEEKPQKPLKERTSRAERRANQEAQRAAKAAGAGGGTEHKAEGGSHHAQPHKEGGKGGTKPAGSKETPHLQKKASVSLDQKSTSGLEQSSKTQDKKKKKDVPAPRMQFDNETQVAKVKKRAVVEQTETKNRVELFRHLPQFDHSIKLASLETKYFREDALHPHPAIYKAGIKFLTGDVVGGNARCVLMLMAFREMIGDYTTPPGKIFNRDLAARISSHVSFLTTCRPLAVSMGNAIKFLKTVIVGLDATSSESEAKSSLIVEINRFIQEKIIYAGKEIVRHAVQKIRDGDVCLTFGASSVVEMILLHAHERGKKFRVVVVDSRPKLEGKGLLRRLLGEGIDCTYTHLNGVSYIMREVTRVFLGAASVLSNGAVYSRVGTASVAMVAHSFSVPVMICCETYKFHERVQLDSITANELGDPDALVDVSGRCNLNVLEGWADDSHLQLLNLIYDATPSDYVSMIITELGMVPPTSVPVILREYRKDAPL